MFDAQGLKFGLYNALLTFKNYKDAWKKMIVRCMSMNFSWYMWVWVWVWVGVGVGVYACGCVCVPAQMGRPPVRENS